MRCRIDHELVVFELQGHVGPSTAALLETCLDAAFDIDAASVVIDLTAVDELAEAGVSVLSEMRSRCAASGRSFRVRSDRAATSGLLDRFDWDDSAAPRSVAVR
ncbi:MAG TPA: STAS domain-containing protein [Acidimicrobiales bacterium]|nr:STAS domain-containing protein [Acidimicrobiales bacterium]